MLDDRLVEIVVVDLAAQRRVEQLLLDHRVDLEFGADLPRQLLLGAVAARFLELLEQRLDLAMILGEQLGRVELLVGHHDPCPPRLRVSGTIRRGARFLGVMNDTETLSEVLPNETEEATRRLLEKAHERGLMLATAESCTGGMLASLLTDVQGVVPRLRPRLRHLYERSEERDARRPDGADRAGRRGVEGGGGGDGGRGARQQPRQHRACGDRLRRRRAGAGAGPFRLRPGGPRDGASRGAFRPGGRGATRIKCMKVAVEMMTEML
jgi:nicotinamide-nucleotide amidase